ncbi:MAG: ribosome biogenesis GTP-binding protein YihA/YsxC [Bacilli bacterium]
MIIRSATFLTSAVRLDQCPVDGEPEIAFVGRSNVGKSSLLNKLLNRRHLVRISSSPGKTQLINFFHINEQFYLVDFPGYGYAKVSKDVQATWGPMIERYLIERTPLALVVQLVDIRHPPSREDALMHEWLAYIGRPCLIVATKADKISRGVHEKHCKVIRTVLKLSDTDKIILSSAEKGLGIAELWDSLAAYTSR